MKDRLFAAFSDYLRGEASLDDLQRLLAIVDWDDPSIPPDIRDSLMDVDLIITGIQEGFGDEQELLDFLKKTPLLALRTF